MGAIRAAIAAAALLWPTVASADPVDRWALEIAQASQRFGIPGQWIRRVMSAESGGRTSLAGRPIESRAGAMGLMQLMPGTWRDMRSLLRLGSDPFDPEDNILAGAAYLRRMYDRFGYPGLFAAYNAGPANYSAYLAGRRPLPAETRSYVESVTGAAAPSARRVAGRSPWGASMASPVFTSRTAEAAPANSFAPASTGLFVPLSAGAER